MFKALTPASMYAIKSGGFVHHRVKNRNVHHPSYGMQGFQTRRRVQDYRRAAISSANRATVAARKPLVKPPPTPARMGTLATLLMASRDSRARRPRVNRQHRVGIAIGDYGDVRGIDNGFDPLAKQANAAGFSDHVRRFDNIGAQAQMLS